METQFIEIEKERFEEIFDIMQKSFPQDEYRPKEEQKKLFDKDGYTVLAQTKNGKAISFLAFWYIDNFAFVEHFALLPEYREHGIGSKFLDSFADFVGMPIVLEVEDNDGDTAQRRISFYKRHGFILSDVKYIQPDMRKNPSKVPLVLMYLENGGKVDLRKAKDLIFKNIYELETKGNL